jgi:methylenetetrahydrofolate reductase (NADPH)
MSQLTVVPKTFHLDIPQELATEAEKCKTDEEMKQLGIEWGISQCKELIAHGVPSIHFYTMSAVDSIRQIAESIY